MAQLCKPKTMTDESTGVESMETPGVWNVILDGDLRPLVPGPSRPATSASCVHAVSEIIKEKTCYAHTILQQ